MLPRRKPPKSGIERNADRIRSPGHRKWVRGFQCVCLDTRHSDRAKPCHPLIECAHVRTGTDGGTGIKPSDAWTVPLCMRHHAEQHAIGEPAFERKYGVNLKRIAEDLARRSPHLRKLARDEQLTEMVL